MTNVEKLLVKLGANTAHKGFRYLSRAVEIARNDPGTMQSYMKTLLPMVAAEFNATASSVERCIRTTITQIYDTNLEIPPEFTPNAMHGAVTNKDFINRMILATEDERSV